MAEGEVTDTKLHKDKDLLDVNETASSIDEKKEDPDELGSEDFKKAAHNAEVLKA